MMKSILGMIVFLALVAAILLGEKLGYKKEFAVGAMTAIFISFAFSLYRLKSKDDLSDTFLKSIYTLRGRREALFWGWFIWSFSLVCFVLAIMGL